MTAKRDFDPAQAARPGSLAHLCLAYLADLARRNFSRETVAVRRRYLRFFVDYLAERGVHDAAQVTRPMVERYQRHWFHARKEDGTPYTVRYQIQCVKPVQMLFRWAVKRHHLPANPAADLDYPRPIQTLPDVLSLDDAEAILAQPDTAQPLGLRDRAILEMLYSTGMRRMEICNLRLDDLDSKAGLVRIRQGKGHKDRIVPVGGRALHWCGRYAAETRPQLSRDAADLTVFLSRNGAPLGRGDVSVLTRRYVQQSGVRRSGSCHLFRHTMATLLLQNGCDVRVIQEMLGHAKLDTTALYTHVGVSHLKKAHSAFHPAEG